MNKQLLAKILAPAAAVGATLGLTTPSPASPSTEAAVRLLATCDTAADVPTLMLAVSGAERTKTVSMLSFLSEYFSPEQALETCQRTAEALHSLYQDDSAQYLVSDRLGSQPVVCAVERRGVGCNSYAAQVLFSLDPTTDPNLALYNMLGSEFKQSEPPTSRTVGRMYADIERPWISWLDIFF